MQDYDDYNALLKTYNKAKAHIEPDSDNALHLLTMEKLISSYAKIAFTGF